MSDFMSFLVLGLGLGAVYALAGQGLVLIYRGSRVVNFAQGAIALVGAGTFWELRKSFSALPAFVGGIVVCVAIGWLINFAVIRRLSTASQLAKVVATLGVLAVIQQAAAMRFGSQPRFVTPLLPQAQLDIGSTTVAIDRLVLICLACVVSGFLWAVYRYTRFGLATTASSENGRALSALGYNTQSIAAANWAIGSGLAGAAGILVAPIVSLQPATLTMLIVPVLAAAVIGNFSSFPLTLAGGLLIGVAESQLTNYSSRPGVPQAVPFLVVIGVVLFRRDVLAARVPRLLRLPRVGTGRVRPVVVGASVSLAVASLMIFSDNWAAAMTYTMCVSIIALSLVALTGYAGQVSLGQFALAGLGAWVSTRLADAAGVPFVPAVLLGVAAVVPMGVVFALPALRTRGVALAVVTLGLGIAVQKLILNNPELTGGPITGTMVDSPSVLGIDLSTVRHPERYAAMTIVVFTALALVVANVRRGRVGRRLIAVRTNERAAAALGISVVSAKLFAFALASGIAAVGGSLLAFRNNSVSFDQYTPLQSILLVLWGFLGGIGYLAGPILAASFAVGSIMHEVLEHFFDVGSWVTLIGGALVIVTVIHQPDGAASHVAEVLRVVRRKRSENARAAIEIIQSKQPTADVEMVELEVRGLEVRFGGVKALTDVSFKVRSGEVLGLIGPNGAGKSTLVDAVCGLNRKYRGSVILNGQSLDDAGPSRRARHGIGRSFQGLELFEDLTVFENILTAVDDRDRKAYATSLFWPGRPQLTRAAIGAIDEFELRDVLDKTPSQLPYGTRRLIAVARAVAAAPSVLLLDEPAAGLDEVRSRELGHLIRRMADQWKIAVVLIEHDVPLVMSVCDRVCVLNFGELIAEGPPGVVKSNSRVVEAYLGGRPQDEPTIGTLAISAEL